MKIVYIAHPIGGNVTENLCKIRDIIREINIHNPGVVPFVPYFADAMSMDDSIPAERSRAIKNNMELLNRKGVVDEIWLYGHTITKGMRQEVETAIMNKIPVVASSPELYNEFTAIKSNYERTNQ